ncbi:MAG: 3-oxoacyl-ACP synthase [Bacteroidota bacterium]|nr:3-oxoacyl-ACP synthase [Bacteroidota bacterium]
MAPLSKEKIIAACNVLLQQKIADLNAALNSVNEAANNETKSTAGDKHETAKAMMQLEQEKLSNQLTLLITQLNDLQKIDVSKSHVTIGNGSVVSTNNGILFIGVGLGKIKIKETDVFAISVLSPLANLLNGKKVNDSVKLNETNYTILGIN